MILYGVCFDEVGEFVMCFFIGSLDGRSKKCLKRQMIQYIVRNDDEIFFACDCLAYRLNQFVVQVGGVWREIAGGGVSERVEEAGDRLPEGGEGCIVRLL